MMEILIIENESIIAEDIKLSLEHLNYTVVGTAHSYNEALYKIKTLRPKLLLVDINLQQEKDGIEIVLESMKQHETNVIYLTSFYNDNIVQRAMQTNPLSYILKPFKLIDLKIALSIAYNKLCNISNPQIKQTHILTKEYSFNTDTQSLYFQGTIISLGIKERQLLLLLIQNMNSFVSFETIENIIYSNTPVSDSTIRTLIYRLRGKLEPGIIETVPKLGCRLLKNQQL